MDRNDWQGEFVEIGDLRIHYVRAGSGAPIVLLHGWPEFVLTWKYNIPELSNHFDIIAPELRGFGQTQFRGEPRAGGTTPQQLAKDLRGFADALELDKFGIVSHDVGAFAAQASALAYPDRITGLFFFNCPYPGVGKRWGDPAHFSETWYQYFHQKRFAAELVGFSRDTCRIYLRHFLSHWSHDPNVFESDLEAWTDNFMRPGNLQGGFDWYVGAMRLRKQLIERGAPNLPKIKVPTRVLWGEEDPVIPIEWADKLGDFFEAVEFSPAPNAGHFVHYEQPELANREIIRFFLTVLE